MGVRLFSKRSLRFSHEINHLEVIYADLISQRRGKVIFARIRRAFEVIPSV